MNHILKKYCPRIEFDSYEDFFENFKIDVPEAFNFGFDVVDELARVDPEKRALVWCDDRDEERTREAVGGEYYNLHDMAWRDSDGYCFFVGRNDDVIKCSGYRIGPFEVESALVEHPAVVECAVTAAPDPIRGKVVKATVVLARGYEPSDELVRELQNHVKHTTAPYKYPRIVEFVDELPKTIGGKIKRKLIRNNDGIED